MSNENPSFTYSTAVENSPITVDVLEVSCKTWKLPPLKTN